MQALLAACIRGESAGACNIGCSTLLPSSELQIEAIASFDNRAERARAHPPPPAGPHALTINESWNVTTLRVLLLPGARCLIMS